MKELLAAAAGARVTDLKYDQNIGVWSGYSRYHVFIPYGYRYDQKFEVRASSIDMKRVFGGIFLAMEDAELSSPGSLLTQAIDTTGTNKFGKSMMLLHSQTVQGNTLLHVDLLPLCKVLASIGNALQEGRGGSDREKAFWNAHLGAVKNKVTWYDTFNFCSRSEHSYCKRNLALPHTEFKWHQYLEAETPAQPPAPPIPSPDELDVVKTALIQTTAALVQNAYDDELTRLRTGGAAPNAIVEIEGNSELMRQFDAARDKARADFLAEQPPPPAVAPEPEPVPVAPPPPRWPDDPPVDTAQRLTI